MPKLPPQTPVKSLLICAIAVFVGAFSTKSHGQLLLIENFNGVAAGSTVSGTSTFSPWSYVDTGADSGGYTVIDTAPGSVSDHVLTTNGLNNGAKISTLTPVGDVTNTVGTLFFQANFSNFSAGASFGLGPSTISDFSGYNTQLAFTGAGAFVVQNGGSQATINNVSLSLNTWYNFWVVADNSTNTWTAYIQGGSIGSVTQLATAGGSTFGFRNTAAGNITTFMVAKGGGSTANPVYLDDIYFGLGNLAGINPIPEPSSSLLIGAGVGLLALRRRRFSPAQKQARTA